jgi:RHS repeat-associated protein
VRHYRSGTLTEAYRTDAFRVPTHMQGTSGQPFQFAGQQRDNTGLYDLRARYDDPSLGRFLGRDPARGCAPPRGGRGAIGG